MKYLTIERSGLTIVVDEAASPPLLYVVSTARLGRLPDTHPSPIIWNGHAVHGKGRDRTSRRKHAVSQVRTCTFAYGLLPPGIASVSIRFWRRDDFPWLPHERRVIAAALPEGVWGAEIDGLWRSLSVIWPGGEESHTFGGSADKRVFGGRPFRCVGLSGIRSRRLPRGSGQYGPSPRT